MGSEEDLSNPVLENEKQILEKAEEILENNSRQDCPLYQEYKFLYKKYKKLYKQIQHILKISDSYQKNLIETRNQLQEEIKEKNKTEEKLKEKIEELEETKKELTRISSRDQLTGLYNRREFEKIIKREWRNAIREGHPISLIMIDIDHFKKFNDTYGHIAGDNCLQKLSKTMNQTLQRPRDFLARYGGEEFISILPRTDAEGAEHVAESLRKNVIELEIPHKNSPIAEYVTISLGVAATAEPGLYVFEEILDEVDQALYEAKEKGRNQYYKVKL